MPKKNRLQDQILELLKESDKTLLQKEIADKLQVHQSSVSRAINK